MSSVGVREGFGEAGVRVRGSVGVSSCDLSLLVLRFAGRFVCGMGVSVGVGPNVEVIGASANVAFVGRVGDFFQEGVWALKGSSSGAASALPLGCVFCSVVVRRAPSFPYSVSIGGSMSV